MFLADLCSLFQGVSCLTKRCHARCFVVKFTGFGPNRTKLQKPDTSRLIETSVTHREVRGAGLIGVLELGRGECDALQSQAP